MKLSIFIFFCMNLLFAQVPGAPSSTQANEMMNEGSMIQATAPSGQNLENKKVDSNPSLNPISSPPSGLEIGAPSLIDENKKILDEVSGDFDIVVNTKDNLIDYLFEEFIPKILQKNKKEQAILDYFKNKGYTTSFGYALNKTLQGDFYNYYTRKINKDGKINLRHNVVDEYFIDFYVNNEISVLHRIDWFQKNSGLYNEAYGRRINLIIITDDPLGLYNDLSILDMRVLGQPGVFFIDMNKLDYDKEPWENLFQFNLTGSVYQVVTDDLSRREFRYEFEDKKIRRKVGKV